MIDSEEVVGYILTRVTGGAFTQVIETCLSAVSSTTRVDVTSKVLSSLSI